MKKYVRTKNQFNEYTKRKEDYEKGDEPQTGGSFPKRLKNTFLLSYYKTDPVINDIINKRKSPPSLDIARQVFADHPFFTVFSTEVFRTQYQKSPRFFWENYRAGPIIKYRLYEYEEKYSALTKMLITLYIEYQTISFNTLITSDTTRLQLLFDKINEVGVQIFYRSWLLDTVSRRAILGSMESEYGKDSSTDEEFTKQLDTLFQTGDFELI